MINRISILFLLASLAAAPALAQTSYTWNGGTGDWADAARWTPAGVPAEADTAIINSGTATLTEDTEVAVFELNGFSVLTGDADFTVTDAMIFSGGGVGITSIQGTGTVTVAPGATLLLTGPSKQFSSGRTLVNAGTATWEMTGDFRGSGQVVNEGEMIISVDAPEPVRLCLQSNPAGITNGPTGLIRRTGPGEAQFHCIFNNHGTVRVEQGALDLRGFHPLSGDDTGPYEVWEDATLVFGGGTRTMSETSSVTGAGTVEVRGGTTTLAGAFDVPTTRMPLSPLHGRFDFNADAATATLLQEQHALGGSGTLTVTESYSWTGGNLSGPGTLIVVPGATLSISGPARNMEHSWTLRHEGTGEWDATIGSNFGGGTIHNAGTLTVTDGAVSNSLRVINAGTVTKTSPGEAVLQGNQSISNHGVMTVAEGTLRITGAAPDAPDAGTYSVDEGATLILGTPGGRTLSAEAVIGGAGTFHYAGSPVTNHGTIRPGLSPGILTFDGNHPALQADGVLEIELAGYEPGTEYDQFVVTGTVHLGGILHVVLLDGFVPEEDDRFLIIPAASVAGEFAALDLPQGVSAGVEVVEAGVELVVGVTVSSEFKEAFPLTFALGAAYPNPFNPSTQITYDLPEPAHVVLRVFDALGREVAVLVDQQQAVGRYDVTFDSGTLPSGLYLYRMEAGEFRQVRTMVVVK